MDLKLLLRTTSHGFAFFAANLCSPLIIRRVNASLIIYSTNLCIFLNIYALVYDQCVVFCLTDKSYFCKLLPS